MGKQLTEMLKGTMEGLVLAILSGRPAYGYEITAWLRDQGFSDIAADPVELIEAFLRNYPEGGLITRERERLIDAIERAAGNKPGRQGRSV